MSPKEKKLLKHLSNYKYLTKKQIARLGLEKWNSNFSNFNSLMKTDFIGIEANIPILENLETIYYLKKKGAQFLANGDQALLNNIHYRKQPIKRKNIEHAILSNWIYIELSLQSLDKMFTMDFYDRDIDNASSKKDETSKTVLQNRYGVLIPDAICHINNRLFTIEFQNMTTKSLSVDKILQHCDHIDNRSVGKKYELYAKSGNHKLHRNLFVFNRINTTSDIMKNVLRHLQVNLLPRYRQNDIFLFKDLSEILPEVLLVNGAYKLKENIPVFQKWHTINGRTLDLFN